MDLSLARSELFTQISFLEAATASIEEEEFRKKFLALLKNKDVFLPIFPYSSCDHHVAIGPNNPLTGFLADTVEKGHFSYLDGKIELTPKGTEYLQRLRERARELGFPSVT